PVSIRDGSTIRWLGAFALPVALLLGWAMYIRIQSLRLVYVAHFGDRATAIGRASRIRGLTHAPSARVWLALTHLWGDDPRGAEHLVEETAATNPDLDAIGTWIRASRGELDLERALTELEPPDLAGQYRWAVALALAALRAERRDQVLGRVAEWRVVADAVPNRFGRLLAHLCDRIDGTPRAADPDLGWVAATWPFTAR
ncbi:MAG: hypothetical protein ABMB14_29310, partial [Myxococcota bacterium]